MPSVKVYKMDGSVAGEMQLSDKIFNAEYNEPLIHQAVVTRLANDRQGTKSTLTRTEVRGGGAKPWRQKGTGRARQGSIRAPQWTKGGVVFAPKSRDFSKKMNAEAKRNALFSALSKKVADGELIVVDKLEVSAPKTKEMVKFLDALKLDKRTLVVMDNDDVNVILAARNIQKLSTMPVAEINTYEVVANAKVVLTRGAVEKIQEVYGA
ncbi:MAG TPA: 50S ribosomal protein L4 [Candidatus Borkfalkia avistercoris]|uniref:Large ribosomal subunit protein uL4 n=1 Tax=Candidatus Borkfalkia avistercoris TaxID=2838504 RepID=A0A9D2CYQ8_9FIRM|nr:50S ribosomal protein L4 [Candidatus Borkfalkia avistercoris]